MKKKNRKRHWVLCDPPGLIRSTACGLMVNADLSIELMDKSEVTCKACKGIIAKRRKK